MTARVLGGPKHMGGHVAHMDEQGRDREHPQTIRERHEGGAENQFQPEFGRDADDQETDEHQGAELRSGRNQVTVEALSA